MTAQATSTSFAPATGAPVSTIIHTDASGLVTADVFIPTARDDLPAYVARPEGPGPFPVILVAHEIFGVHQHIRDVSRRLAKLGYIAVAPELFFRQGDPKTFGDIITALRDVAPRVPDGQALADLDAAAAWAGRNGGDAGRLGLAGFCWGGRIAWLYAAHNPRLRAGVAWYGRLTGEASANQPRHPVDVAAGLTVPVLGLHGGADLGIPLDTVEATRAALKSGGAPGEIVVFDDAPHAFYGDYGRGYREQAAAQAWARQLDWFARHGL